MTNIMDDRRYGVHRPNRVMIFNLIVPICLILLPSIVFGQGPRVIEITATKDNKFKVPGQKGDPVINLKPGEVVKLRFTSFKGPEFEKDGTAHNFNIKEFQDQGWNLRLKEGKQEFTLVVPDKPGEYKVECSVKCGKGHEEMRATLVVKP